MARISPLPPKEWPPEMREAFAALRPPHTTEPALRTEGRPRLSMPWARWPTIPSWPAPSTPSTATSSTRRPCRPVTASCWSCGSPRCASDYEWAQHIVLGADVGLTDDEIDRIAQGSGAPGWPPLDRAMLRAAEELVDQGMVSDPTWQALAVELDDRQLMDLVFTVGTYEILAMAFRSFGVELDDDLRRK